MKNFLFLFLSIIILVCSCKPKSSAPKSIQPDSLKAITVVLDVEGMTCTGCENTISNAVKQLGGIVDIIADHQSGRVEVTYDTTLIDIQSISQAITEKGYTVKGQEEKIKP
ncbi:MAG: copper chaperone [Bacteroidales bacterium]|jgi:copper chaperone CopZ|nr:copper chaperone [Bacteroidales bacterium]MDN5330334.1 copper chaperone [Bacteroidales bacterium]